MKHIFFKTVRQDGSSIWAIDKYKMVYKIGERYAFNKKTPAHVFLYERRDGYSNLWVPDSYTDKIWTSKQLNSKKFEQPLHDHDFIYRNRAENYAASRVLICYGDLACAKVPVCLTYTNWDFTQATYKIRYVSTDFVVIGEIKPTLPNHIDEDRPTDIKLIQDIK